jgi:hypothetical protein
MKNKFQMQFGLKPLNLSLLLKGIIAFLLLTQSFWVQANNYAQQTKLTLSLNNTTLKKALAEIEKKSEFYFMYNSTQIDTKQRVSINVVEATIFQILDKMLETTGISYEISNRQIILTPKNDNKTSQNILSDDKIKITGTVYDQNNVSLPGVSVVVKGS